MEMKEGATTREKLRHTALTLIRKKGFKATTMRDIAGELGCDVANLYNYIQSKQELLEFFVSEISDELETGMNRIFGSKLSAKEKVKAIICMHIDIMDENPYQAAVMFDEWRNLSDDTRKELGELRKTYEDKLMQIIAAGIQDGAFHEMDLQIAAKTLLSSFRWMYSWFGDHKSKVDKGKLQEEVCAILLRGLTKQ